MNVKRLCSTFVLLGVLAASAGAMTFEDSPRGWASYNALGFNGTTGGAGGPTVTATTEAQFRTWATSVTPGPLIIQVQGTIALASRVDVSPNKTIIGIGHNPTITGSTLRVRGQDSGGRLLGHNVIIRNLLIRDVSGGDGDGILIQDRAHHVWIDHVSFAGTFGDGALDITHGSNYITVSWCHFYNHDHISLVGNSDDNASVDAGNLRVTFHHNWFQGTESRHPRVRFSGLTHVFNNFYDGVTGYGIASTCDAEVLVEGNYFRNVANPTHVGFGTSPDGDLVQRHNIFTNSGVPETRGTVPEPSSFYAYTLDSAADIPNLVMRGAGVNKLFADFHPPTPNPMTWATPPYSTGTDSISMVAATATDPDGVEYFFANITDPSRSSGWQDSPSYTATGLMPNTTYTFQVRARDKSPLQNLTAWSAPASATTDVIHDPEAPTPNPMTWAIAPTAVSYDRITMTASTASDISGVEYYFANVTEPSRDSGWQDSATFTDTGLVTGRSYTYMVKARDKSPARNETAWSVAAAATPVIRTQYQAENAFIHLGSIATEHAGFTGSGYVDVTNVVGSYVEWTVDTPFSGTHTLAIRFANGSAAARNVEIRVNGAIGIASLTFPQTGAWPNWSTLNFNVVLTAGTNTVRATSLQSTGGPNYDRLDIVTMPADTAAPMPNPMTWAVAPHATGVDTISMTATTAVDVSGVEYFFANITDPSRNSGWQDSATFIDSGLAGNTEYVYRVIARDKSAARNETAWSAQAGATTLRYICGGLAASDLDANCQVDFRDYAFLGNAWAGGQPAVDLTGDGLLDLMDLAQFAQDWLSCSRLPETECWQ
ncbi:MAG TPA: carbohydrate-binding protein [Sedimentisphaerales bacterium]|nr:carbohydrate-binding protein [Sedimentisphaerales bacterium]